MAHAAVKTSAAFVVILFVAVLHSLVGPRAVPFSAEPICTDTKLALYACRHRRAKQVPNMQGGRQGGHHATVQ